MAGRASLITASLVAALLLVVPASAGAANTYADEDRPNDTADCLTPATACRTITSALSKSGPGDTTFVDGGSYVVGVNEGFTLFPTAGRSLIYQEINASDGPAIVDGGAGVAIQIDDATTAGTIQGLTLRGANTAVYAYGSGTFTGNTFDDDVDPAQYPNLWLIGDDTGESFTVTNNTFSDPTVTDDQQGIRAEMSANTTATISGNSFNGFFRGVYVTGNGSGTQQLSDNTFTGTHEDAANSLPGNGIWIEGGPANLVGNRIQQPGSSAGAGNSGIVGSNGASLTFARNQVYSMNAAGLDLTDTTTVTLNGDVIANNPGSGLSSTDNTGGGVGDVTARNLTAWGNGTDVLIGSVTLTLTSGIVEDEIYAFQSFGGEDPNCVITASRGPLMNPILNFNCENFQTTAAPGFVDPTTGINNFHLTAGSPMIDMGSTVAPPPGTLDLDGGERIVAGVCGGTPRADIGADEFVPNCTVPSPGPATNPECDGLRAKLARLSKKLKNADDPEQKGKLKKARRKVRKRIAALGCP